MNNGLKWNAEVPLHTMKYDTVQEWNFVGTDGGPGHRMHTHVWNQQICGTGKSCTDSCVLMMEYGQFIDNVKIDNTNNYPYYNRFKNVKIAGKVILNFHHLMHEDVDMMVWVDTVGVLNIYLINQKLLVMHCVISKKSKARNEQERGPRREMLPKVGQRNKFTFLCGPNYCNTKKYAINIMPSLMILILQYMRLYLYPLYVMLPTIIMYMFL